MDAKAWSISPTSCTGRTSKPLRDRDRFAQFYLDYGLATIAWLDGADFAPEFLYEQAERDALNVRLSAAAQHAGDGENDMLSFERRIHATASAAATPADASGGGPLALARASARRP